MSFDVLCACTGVASDLGLGPSDDADDIPVEKRNNVSIDIASTRPGTEQMANGQPLRITQPHELDQVMRLPMPSSVVLELTSLSSDETTRWQRDLNTSLYTCGCGEATAALLITIGVMLVGAWFNWNIVKSAPFLSVTAGLVACALSTATGKAVGRLRGHHRLGNTVRQLRSILMQRAFDRNLS